jgi:hypothetical protein
VSRGIPCGRLSHPCILGLRAMRDQVARWTGWCKLMDGQHSEEPDETRQCNGAI